MQPQMVEAIVVLGRIRRFTLRTVGWLDSRPRLTRLAPLRTAQDMSSDACLAGSRSTAHDGQAAGGDPELSSGRGWSRCGVLQTFTSGRMLRGVREEGRGCRKACKTKLQAQEQLRTKILQSFTQAPYGLKANTVAAYVSLRFIVSAALRDHRL